MRRKHRKRLAAAEQRIDDLEQNLEDLRRLMIDAIIQPAQEAQVQGSQSIGFWGITPPPEMT